MKEQLIEFETAKLAKGKGLPLNLFEKCRYYSDDGKVYDFIYSASKAVYYSAPTQGLLQKWLREKHRLYIWVDTIYHDGFNHYINAEYFINDFKVHSDWLRKINENEYDTYEQALEKGLFEALKLIK